MNLSNTQKNQFLERLLEISREYGNEEIIDRFRHVKSEREKYLREQWKEQITGDEGPAFFRDVDFEHLRVLLYNHLDSEPDQYFQFNIALVKACIQFSGYEKAQAILNALLDKVVSNTKQAKVLMLLGKVALLRNEYEQSTEYYKRALSIHDRLQNFRGIASAYNNLGIIAHEQWQAETGKMYFEKANEQSPKHDDTYTKMFIRMNLGIVNILQGYYEKAFRIFESLLENKTEDTNPGIKLHLMINQGISARDAGNYAQAIKILSAAKKLSVEVKNQRLLALSKHGHAETLIFLDELDKCENELVDAFKIFSKIYNRNFIADTYRVFGLVHIERGQYELAESEIQISLRINNENGNIPNLAEAYKAYSKLAKIRGDIARQRECLKKALALCETMQATKRVEQLQGELAALG